MTLIPNLWDDAVAAGKSEVELLVYRSNLLGSDQRVTNTGGGNTSAKYLEADPVTGEPVEVLWVKGSGGDLRTSKLENFASLYQESLINLQKIYAKRSDKGLKEPGEDAMVGMYPHATFNLNPRAASIDTPLHSFIPHKHVDHTHPNSVIAIAASGRAEELTKEIFGDEVAYLPWMRPGFELGLAMQEVCQTNPTAVGIVMGQHGLICWASTAKECYELSLRLINKASEAIESKYESNGGNETVFGGQEYESFSAEDRKKIWIELLPWIRGQIGSMERMIATVQDDENALRFINSRDAERLAHLGTSCPDHFLRTKIRPLYIKPLRTNSVTEFVESVKPQLSQAFADYKESYAAYYHRCRHENSPKLRGSFPTVWLIPGVGMVAWGKDKSESRVTAEFYNCAIEVMRGSEALDRYISLSEQEAFDIEYWLLEEAKLQRMPKEKELARRIFVVVGAGNGIGKASAHRIAKEGATVVCADLLEGFAMATATELESLVGKGIGVAGTGISDCGPAIGLTCNITDRSTVKRMLEQAILAYGGVDGLIVTAGIFPTGSSDADWDKTFAINVTGSHTVANEVAAIFNQQGLQGCSVVLSTSVNAVVAKKGSVAYDVSKAAVNHLIRELAMELAPLARVNGVAPATVVAGSTMFPRNRVIDSLTKYNLPFDESMTSEELSGILSKFYSTRNLLGASITPHDQAEAVFLLASDRLSKTSGQIISVDGGLHEAFLR